MVEIGGFHRTMGNKRVPHAALTWSERRCLQMSAQGLTYAEMAEVNGSQEEGKLTSLRTTEAHSLNAFRKLDVHTHFGAVIAGYKKGLLDVDRIVCGFNIDLVSNLTSREKEVAEVMTDDYNDPSLKRVADVLGISEKTVGVHISNIVLKLKAEKTMRALILYMEAKRQGKLDKAPEKIISEISLHEIKIMQQFAGGLNPGEIARRFGLSVRQLMYRLKHGIFKELNVNSKLGAILVSVKMGLIGADEITKNLDVSLVGLLTPEEKAKIRAIIDFNGVSQAKLGSIINCSRRTIETHLRNATKKIGAKNNTQTIILVMEADRQENTRMRDEEIGDDSQLREHYDHGPHWS